MATKIVSRSVKQVLTQKRFLSISDGNIWTPDNIVKSPHRDIAVPTITIPEHMWNGLDKWADKTATVCGLTNHSYSYYQLYKQSRNLAARLRTKLKINDGDRVCIMMPNTPEYPIAVLGILQAGGIATTVNPLYTAHELHKQLVLSDPKIIIGSQETFKIIKEAFQIGKKEIHIILVTDHGLPEGTISFKEFSKEDADHTVLNEVRRNSDDVALLPYSSGTTGLPKGVELMHKNIIANCVQQDVEGVKQYHDTTSTHQDTAICILPFYHCYALTVLLFHKLSVGAKLVTLPRFQTNNFIRVLTEYSVSLLYAAPPLILFLASDPNVRREHLQSVNKIMSGAAPLPKYDIERVIEKSKSDMNFLNLYGLTETSPVVSTTIVGDRNYTNAGVAVSNTELKVVDSELRALGPNEVGELLVRGPQVMKGYKNNPDATRNSITEDGWFKTGDLVSIDKNGAIIVADRIKELIKVKGYQVPPAELESILKEHPDILDAGVIGVPDQRLGEAPKAFVVLKDGRKAESNEIANFVNGRVTKYKRIKEIVFLESLPKNPSGKLLRRVLKERNC